MSQAIGDRAAIEFAKGFYDGLGAGRSIEEAFELGCTAIDLENISESETPVLKTRQVASINPMRLEPPDWIEDMHQSAQAKGAQYRKLMPVAPAPPGSETPMEEQPPGFIADGVIAPNPFGDTGRITAPERFFGREALLHQLFEELNKGSNRSLVGDAQVGKSSILWMVCKLGPERLQLPPAAFIYLDMRNVYNEQDFFECLCHELGIASCRGFRLSRALRDKRYILCIDEIDNMAREEHFTGQERTELCGLADGADMPLTLLIASQKSLRDLFPDSPLRTSPLAGICQQIDVGPFSADEAQRFLKHRLANTNVSFSESQIQEMIAESGGYPGYLQHLAADLYRCLIQISG